MKSPSFKYFFILSIFIISCKKDNPTIQPAAIPYMSVSANSSWQYQLTDNIISKITNYSLTSTSRDTSINSKSYHIFTNSNGGLSEYFNISGAEYYSYRDLGVNIGNSKIEILYLKDNLALGATWQQSTNLIVSGLTIPLTMDNKVIEKGLNLSVNGNNYTDVIHISSTISSSAIPADKLITEIHNYYAPKVGVILSTNNIQLNYIVVSNINNKTILLSSIIK